MDKKIAITLALVLAAVLSFFVIAPWATTPENHSSSIASIDQKIETVMKLTAGSTTASALISAMPGDTATPIADQLAEFSTYFMIALCALYLEKYLITITGFAAFRILIPAAALMVAAGLYWNKAVMQKLSKKLVIFALSIFLLVPTSCAVSDLIYSTYASSIQATLDGANQDDLIPIDEDSGDLATWFVDRATNITSTASGILRRFVEALAVMIVISCLIPLMVVVFFAWLMKAILGVDAPMKLVGKRKAVANAIAEALKDVPELS